jgi:hypothetical protein
MKNLLDTYRDLLTLAWASVFSQRRTLDRAIRHALAMPSVLGRRTVSRTICALGRQMLDWASEYRLYSRGDWKEDELTDPVAADYLRRFPDGPILIGVDDTGVPKTGKRVPNAQWQYDHQSPPFHCNLVWAQRFVVASLLYPLHALGDYSARALPLRFRLSPAVKKPGKRASEADRKEYREKKKITLSTQVLAVVESIRKTFDRLGATTRNLLVVGDGAFCNRTFFMLPLMRKRCILNVGRSR